MTVSKQVGSIAGDTVTPLFTRSLCSLPPERLGCDLNWLSCTDFCSNVIVCAGHNTSLLLDCSHHMLVTTRLHCAGKSEPIDELCLVRQDRTQTVRIILSRVGYRRVCVDCVTMIDRAVPTLLEVIKLDTGYCSTHTRGNGFASISLQSQGLHENPGSFFSPDLFIL